MWNRVRRHVRAVAGTGPRRTPRASPSLAIDLGTARTRIVVPGDGVVLDEPSVVAVRTDEHGGPDQVLGRGTAVGRLARQMLGRTPDSIRAVCPLRDGAITDFALCEAMLRYFLNKATPTRGGVPGFRTRPTVLVATPQRLTSVERQAVFNSVERAGAGSVQLIDSAAAAAIGSGLPIGEPIASLLADLGAGTTDVALLSMGATVASESVRIAGRACDEAIETWMRRHHSLRIGSQTSEQIKLDIGTALPPLSERETEVRGLDTVAGIPRRSVVTSEEAREAMTECLDRIADAVSRTIEQAHPELVADLAETGLMLTGGLARLPRLDEAFEHRLGLAVRVAASPDLAVSRGLEVLLDHAGRWDDVLTRTAAASPMSSSR